MLTMAFAAFTFGVICLTGVSFSFGVEPSMTTIDFPKSAPFGYIFWSVSAAILLPPWVIAKIGKVITITFNKTKLALIKAKSNQE